MNNSADEPASHFIAINYHGFHDVDAALNCVRSVLLSAKALTGEVRITLFNHSDQPAPPKLTDTLMELGVAQVNYPESPNGESLNHQIDQAQGFDFFYRVDADDLVSEGRFGWQSTLMEQTSCDICGGGLIYHNIETGSEHHVLPPEHPGTMAYLFNHYFLHPTVTFRMSALNRVNLRYGNHRLEDKCLALSAYKSGLKVVNDRKVYGTYNLNPNARNALLFARRNRTLNLAFIRATHSYWAFPLAHGIFALSIFLRQDHLRTIRKTLFHRRKAKLAASSEFACENVKAEKNPPPSL